MTSRPPIALVKRDNLLFISGIFPAVNDDGLLRVFVRSAPPRAFLGRVDYGPTGEGETQELAAQDLVEKLKSETIDFATFLLALANGAEAKADSLEGAEEDVSALEQDAMLLRTLAGLAAQEHRDEQIANMLVSLDELFAEVDIHRTRLAEAMFDAGWRFTGGRRDGPG